MTTPVQLSDTGATVDTLLTTVKNSNLSATHKITRSATIVIAANNSSAKSKAQADYVCDGVADNVEIQAAMNALSTTGGRIILLEGRYYIVARITGNNNIDMSGVGFGTILDVTGIGTNDVILLGTYSSLSNLKISGSINPLPASFHQRTMPQNFCRFENLWLDNVGRGLECGGRTDVIIKNVILTNIRDEDDWGAAIHMQANSKRIWVNGFYIQGCNRGVEIEDGADWIVIENGYMKDIQNYNSTGHEPFAIDVHTHSSVPVTNVTYRNIYAENTYPPQSRQTDGTGVNENITFENIQLVSPSASIELTGKNIVTKNITGATKVNVSSAESVSLERISGTQLAGSPFIVIGNDVLHTQIEDCRITANATPAYGIQINGANSKNIKIIGNVFESTTFPACIRMTSVGGLVEIESNYSYIAPFISGYAGDCKFKNNFNYKTEKTGTATITTGQTTMDVTHGLAAEPTRVILTPTTALGGKFAYVSAKAASTFTITIDSAHSADISFDWYAVV